MRSLHLWSVYVFFLFIFFFFNDTATTEIYTLSLHDALPISIATSNGKLTSPWLVRRRALCFPRASVSTLFRKKRFPPVKQQSCPDLIGTGKRCWLPIAQAFFRLHQPRISSMGCERPLRCYKKRACQMCLIGIIVTPKRRRSPCKRGA